MPGVRVSGWRNGFDKVGATKAIRLAAGIDLGAAKGYTDSILAGSVATIEVAGQEAAMKLAKDLDDLGAKAEWYT